MMWTFAVIYGPEASGKCHRICWLLQSRQEEDTKSIVLFRPTALGTATQLVPDKIWACPRTIRKEPHSGKTNWG